MRNFSILLVFLFFTFGCFRTSTSTSTSCDLPEQGDCKVLPRQVKENSNWDITCYSAYYLFIKKNPSPCQRHFNSDFQYCMEKLKGALTASNKKQKDLYSLMGTPDTIITPEDLRMLKIPRDEVLSKAKKQLATAPNKTYHIYFWRGWHDYLYFEIEKNQIVYSNWYYAYE